MVSRGQFYSYLSNLNFNLLVWKSSGLAWYLGAIHDNNNNNNQRTNTKAKERVKKTTTKLTWQREKSKNKINKEVGAAIFFVA